MLIGKDYKIESDELNVTLYRRHRVKAKNDKPAHDIWTIKGYYSNPKNALYALIELEVNETGLKDLQTIVKRIDLLEDDIKAVLERLQSITGAKKI